MKMMLDDLSGSHMFSDVFIIFSVFSGCFPKKKHLKVPEFADLMSDICCYFREDLLYYRCLKKLSLATNFRLKLAVWEAMNWAQKS